MTSESEIKQFIINKLNKSSLLKSFIDNLPANAEIEDIDIIIKYSKPNTSEWIKKGSNTFTREIE
jgi:hypothetical protein